MSDRDWEIMMLTLGWAWAQACTMLDDGKDPRDYDQAELIQRCREQVGAMDDAPDRSQWKSAFRPEGE